MRYNVLVILLLSVVLCLFINSVLIAQAYDKIVFEDDFADNEKDWWIGISSEKQAKIENGYYIFENKSGGHVFIVKEISIDQNRDFVIETRIKRRSGEGSNGFGIVWNFINVENQNVFYLDEHEDKTFMVGKYYNDAWHPYIDWKKSEYIEEGSFNKLTIKKQSNNLEYYINDHCCPVNYLIISTG